MFTDSSLDLITALSNLAYQYGPFLFALLFSLFITRWAYRIYQKTCVRVDPKEATDREKNTCRIYFLGTAGFSILLVIAAIIWWFLNAPVTYKFMGKIEDLKDYQKTISQSFYLKPSYVIPPDIDLPATHDDHFVIVRNKPFKKGEVFDISICNIGFDGQGKKGMEKLEIKYLGKDYVVYKLKIDPKDGTAILIPKTAYNFDNSPFWGTAIAQESIWDK
jgi:hypothetical protein